MDRDQLLEKLGYEECEHFLSAGTSAFRTAPYVGHVLRHAHEDLPKKLSSKAELLGVYSLSPRKLNDETFCSPLVYVCHAADEATANEIHRLVWCQDVVPFVLVHTPKGLILHSGFRYERTKGGRPRRGILQPLKNFNECHDLIDSFRAESIDSGAVWQRWRNAVTPSSRVDWSLLANLEKLEVRLKQGMKLSREVAHALIGKYVFLHYLRDRQILSSRKLAGWGLEERDVFGQTATLDGLQHCLQQLEAWLNGGVFPLDWSRRDAPAQDHVRAVAATFKGDEPQGGDYWQLSLDFSRYDFSYVPIETLSVVYQQFLHAPDETGKSKGRQRGAYYTPIPLVNLMLARLEEQKPLVKGNRIMDPSCGSGAFLVQAYRRLIEREYQATGKRPSAHELRRLLTDHIFGVDQDFDACGITELSLLMTLLDCVDPPDLERTKNQKAFKLPTLRGKNIVRADFFDDSDERLAEFRKRPFDVVVGNPPWKSINRNDLADDDRLVWEWIKREPQSHSATPVGGNQVAQAFVWKVKEFLADGSEAALLLPAMALFEDRSAGFRRSFFSHYDLRAVVNFANLAEVLFAGRSRVPAAAFFFKPAATSPSDEQWIRVISPMLANQEANLPAEARNRPETWILQIQDNEIRDIPRRTAAEGSGLPWKLAMWASNRDQRLLRRLENRFDSLGSLEGTGSRATDAILLASQGLELREQKGSGEAVEEMPGVSGKFELEIKPLKRLRHLFQIPPSSLIPVSVDRRFIRKGRELPLKVCRPPHVIVSAARMFAVYSDEFFIVPPRQIGIVHLKDDRNFLKALSLFLSSDFAFYHQFLTTAEFGVKRDRATLRSLRRIPVPLNRLSRSELSEWASLRDRLANTRPRTLEETRSDEPELFSNEDDGQAEMLRELNERTYDALQMSDADRSLVHDLVHVMLHLNDGRLGAPAVRPPTETIMRRYAKSLKRELDAFIGDILPKRHNASVTYDERSGMIAVETVATEASSNAVPVRKASAPEAAELANARSRLQTEYSQWVYFNRNLRIYEDRFTYIFKPMQTFHWTQSQAISDATEIIAEVMNGGGAD